MAAGAEGETKEYASEPTNLAGSVWDENVL